MNAYTKIKQSLIITSLALSLGACATQNVMPDSVTPSIAITTCGAYDYFIEKTEESDVSPSGYRAIGSWTHRETTTQIPNFHENAFGFCFSLVGAGSANYATFTVDVTHPEMTNDQGRTSSSFTSVEELYLGDENCELYIFNREFEKTPGDWTYTLSSGGEVLFTKTFEITETRDGK